MKSIFKISLSFSIATAFIFLSLQSFAQPRGMTMNQVYSQLNKQDMNMRFQRQMQTMMMMTLNWRANAGKGTTYQVTLKDSSVKQVVSFMYIDTTLHKNFLLSVDKKYPKSDSAHRYQKIYSDQTLYISAVVNGSSGQESYGVPKDSCWMFKVIDGSLTVYAKSLNYLTESDGLLNTTDFEPSAIVGIQLNDGPIEKYNKENLVKMVGGNMDAVEAIEKKKYYKAVRKYNHDAEKAAKK